MHAGAGVFGIEVSPLLRQAAATPANALILAIGLLFGGLVIAAVQASHVRIETTPAVYRPLEYPMRHVSAWRIRMASIHSWPFRHSATQVLASVCI